MLTRNHRQEGLARAYVQAIAAQAGMSSSVASPDYGIDLSLLDIVKVGQQRIESGYRIDVQAKSTTLARLEATQIKYDLEVPTYENLRYPGAGCPRILVVLVLPDAEGRWLTHSEEELVLRRGAYWLSVRGQKATANRKSVRVMIPRANVFSVAAVQAIMERIKAGEGP